MNVTIFDKYKFFAGVPDSQLKPLCDWLYATHGISDSHIVAPNEGSAVACAAGYHLATGEVPCVYLQNSGIGNIVNPVASLLNDKVYGIPVLFIVGWRGEPDVHDEPQHIFQGEITLSLLEHIGINTFVLSEDTTLDEFHAAEEEFQQLFAAGKSAAFVIRKGGLTYSGMVNYPKQDGIMREEIIRTTVQSFPDAIIVCTTGKASRELFEIRVQNGQGHHRDFYTVGSMGHASSIAFGLAIHQPSRRVIIIDGDGAILMHMGALALIGAKKPSNLVHIVVNNMAHESVGGMPTVGKEIDIANIASSSGYEETYKVCTLDELNTTLCSVVETKQLSLIEVCSLSGSRKNLGRPTITPKENKVALMKLLSQ